MTKSPECLRPGTIDTARIYGESYKTVVFAAGNRELAIKVDKAGKRQFTSVAQAISEINDHNFARSQMRENVERLGSSNEIIPQTHTVVHEGNINDHVAYTEFQRGFPHATPLADRNLSSLSNEALVDLKNIFVAGLDLSRRTRQVVDFIGSSEKEPGRIKKFFTAFFPLRFSQNIIVDEEGKPRMIDIEMLPHLTKSRWRFITQFRRVIGCYLSISIINGVLYGRRGKNP